MRARPLANTLQLVLATNNSIISVEYATGYVTDKWDDRMQILINVTSCGTLMGQAWTKTAFAVTLLKLTKGWSRWVLWFCIVTMNAYMFVKVIFQWAKICEKPSYQVWYRLDFCLSWAFREAFKEGGNGESPCMIGRLLRVVLIGLGSIQHHHGLCPGHLPVVHHVESRHAQSRKDRPLSDYELGK